MAPASHAAYDKLQAAFRILRDDWGLNVLEGLSVQSRHYQFSGSDDLRRRDLQQMLDHPDVRAILAVRGGYGSYRLLDSLDFTAFLKQPKWMVGFSDITAIHCHLHRLGVQSLHAIMPKQFGDDGTTEAIESLRQWLFGEAIDPYRSPANSLNRPGMTSGQLVGGNLSLLMNMLGTPSDPDYRNKILFIEDIDETLFALDRAMCQLRRAGRLQQLAGLLVGQFTDMRLSELSPFGKTANEIIAEHVSDYAYPVCFDFPVGHVPNNLTLPVGRSAVLNVGAAAGASLTFV